MNKNSLFSHLFDPLYWAPISVQHHWGEQVNMCPHSQEEQYTLKLRWIKWAQCAKAGYVTRTVGTNIAPLWFTVAEKERQQTKLTQQAGTDWKSFKKSLRRQQTEGATLRQSEGRLSKRTEGEGLWSEVYFKGLIRTSCLSQSCFLFVNVLLFSLSIPLFL